MSQSYRWRTLMPRRAASSMIRRSRLRVKKITFSTENSSSSCREKMCRVRGMASMTSSDSGAPASRSRLARRIAFTRLRRSRRSRGSGPDGVAPGNWPPPMDAGVPVSTLPSSSDRSIAQRAPGTLARAAPALAIGLIDGCAAPASPSMKVAACWPVCGVSIIDNSERWPIVESMMLPDVIVRASTRRYVMYAGKRPAMPATVIAPTDATTSAPTTLAPASSSGPAGLNSINNASVTTATLATARASRTWPLTSAANARSETTTATTMASNTPSHASITASSPPVGTHGASAGRPAK
mmetsp:Transcript_24223/g.84106  ORF Transcript_24223/g.84106 Transcript_24223/m.84106 type:complete len:297 (+) Transcript_24223:897-1787(+)